jgi:16S rRNA processing protein RimM
MTSDQPSGRRPLPRRQRSIVRPETQDKTTPGSSEPEFLIVGKISRPHGVRGEVGMILMTQHPEHLLSVKKLYVGSNYKPYRVERMRRHQEGMIILFADLKDRDQAELLREQMVHIHMRDAVPLEDGEYYLFQIEGILVVSEEGEELGRLTGLIETGANDVYVVTTPAGGELLLPAIPDVIKNVDVQGGKMTVHLLDGLR